MNGDLYIPQALAITIRVQKYWDHHFQQIGRPFIPQTLLLLLCPFHVKSSEESLGADPLAINGHGGPRYQPQQVRPYGQSSNGYLPDTRTMVQKDDTSQRAASYMAQMSFMEHQDPQPSSLPIRNLI